MHGDRYLELLTHCTNSSLSVYDILSRGIQSVLVPRLSEIADAQLHSVQQLLNQTVLSNEPDKRQSAFLRPDQSLDTAAIYRMIKAKGQGSDPKAVFIWKSMAPPESKCSCGS